MSRTLRHCCLCCLLACLAGAFFLNAAAPVPALAKELPAYEQAKVELARLRGDEKRAKYRHEWLKCADSFLTLYENNPEWNNRAAALFRSAEALEEMARRSFVRKDAQDAAARFELLARSHARSVLADDALYRAAAIRHELMRDPKDARALLESIGKKYPKSDFAPLAVEYLARLDGTSVASLAPAPAAPPKASASIARITGLSPQLRQDTVRIVVSLDRPSPWRIRFQAADAKAGRPPRLLLDLTDAGLDKSFDKAETFSKAGIFTGYSTESLGDGKTRVNLNFSDLYRYTVKAEKSPFRIIIEGTVKTSALTSGITVRDAASQPGKATAAATAPSRPARTATPNRISVPNNMASQLGLTVKTIIIDPGHGGKDPGAMHNGIVEREVCLDVSKRLANVLRAAGYEVILTREKDVFIPLVERPHFASQKKGDLFISIHVNASTKADRAGFETYYLDTNATRDAAALANIENRGSTRRLGDMEEILAELLMSARIQESRRLADAVQGKALSQLKRAGYKPLDGGTRGALFHVLMGTKMPGVLVEIGYCSNAAEAKLLKQAQYRNSIAEGIANGIHQYAQQLETAARR